MTGDEPHVSHTQVSVRAAIVVPAVVTPGPPHEQSLRVGSDCAGLCTELHALDLLRVPTPTHTEVRIGGVGARRRAWLD